MVKCVVELSKSVKRRRLLHADKSTEIKGEGCGGKWGDERVSAEREPALVFCSIVALLFYTREIILRNA